VLRPFIGRHSRSVPSRRHRHTTEVSPAMSAPALYVEELHSSIRKLSLRKRAGGRYHSGVPTMEDVGGSPGSASSASCACRRLVFTDTLCCSSRFAISAGSGFGTLDSTRRLASRPYFVRQDNRETENTCSPPGGSLNPVWLVFECHPAACRGLSYFVATTWVKFDLFQSGVATLGRASGAGMNALVARSPNGISWESHSCVTERI
jgi:hypothetical protein